MKRGIILEIQTDYETTKSLRVLCTFTISDCNYLLAIDEDGDYICQEIEWNFWKGTHTLSKQVCDKAVCLGNTLLRKAEINPDFYTFCAEHYEIDTGEKQCIRKYDQLWVFRPCAKFVPFMIKLAIALLFSAIYAFICTHTSEISIAANVFNGLPRGKLIIIVYMVQLVGAAALYLIRRSKRSLIDLYLNAFIPYNTVALAGLYKINNVIRIAVLSTIVLSLLIWILPKTILAIKTNKKALKIQYIKDAMRRCYIPFVLCLCIAYVSLHFLGLSIYTYSSKEYSSPDIQLCENFYEVKDKLEANKWAEYDIQERLDILQVISDYECLYNLGCDSPKIVAGYPEKDTIYGSYNSISNCITINIEHLAADPAEKVLDTLLHEVRHAYQHAAVNAFNEIEDSLNEEVKSLACFKKIKAYRDNFENYKYSGDDYFDYYFQEVEHDSRSWAEIRISDKYYDYIYPCKSAIQQNSADS